MREGFRALTWQDVPARVVSTNIMGDERYVTLRWALGTEEIIERQVRDKGRSGPEDNFRLVRVGDIVHVRFDPVDPSAVYRPVDPHTLG